MLSLEIILIPLLIYLLTLIFVAMTAKSGCRLHRFYPLAKLLAGLAFIMAAVYNAATAHTWTRLLYLLPALILCVGGDLALGFYKRNRQQKNLVCGICLFLGAHLFFLLAIIQQQQPAWFDLLLPVAVLLLTWMSGRLPGMHTIRLRPLILLYSCFVSLFCSCSLHFAFARPGTVSLCLGIGAALFFISDSLLYFIFFYEKKFPGQGLVCLGTYYLAMLLIAASLLF